MADYEKNLISRILFSGEVKDVMDRKVHEEMFVDERNRKVFIFILAYYNKYSELPTFEIIEQTFPDYTILHSKEPISYCIDKVVETYIRNRGSDILLKHSKKLIDEPTKGLELLKNEFSRLDIETNPTQDSNYLTSIEKRRQKYLDIKELKGMDGYPTPWEVLNECTMGMHEEDFIVIVARPKIGKTWMLTLFAEYVWRNDLSVLFVSNEMSAQQIERRFDAIHFKLPYQSLRAGLLPDAYEKRYFDGMEEIANSNRPPVWIIGDIGGVSAISAKIDEYKPDIVLIDGMYMLQDDKKGGTKWERTSNVSRDLKILAKKKRLPVIATTQFNRAADEAKVKMTEVNLSMLGFSDSIGQDADLVLGLFANKDMKSNKELLVRILAVREGEPIDFTLFWDLHGMEFSVLRVDDDGQVITDNEIDDKDIDF